MIYLARPERFELPTNRFEADYSIQLSYGRLNDDVGYYFYPATAIYTDPVTFLVNCPSGKKKSPTSARKALIYLAPPDGLEPPTR